MARSRVSMHVAAAPAVVAIVLLVAGAAAAGGGGPSPSPLARAAAVETALQSIGTHLDRLHADISRAEHVAASPPEIFSRQLEQLLWQVDDQTRNLVGLHWTIANPVLEKAARVRGRIGELAERLEHWAPKLPPDPDEPLKTSAATGTGAITGTLTDDGTGNPIPYTRVEVTCPDSGFDAETLTDSSGTYVLGGLGTGVYHVVTRAFGTYLNEYYDDLPEIWVGLNPPDPVRVTDGQITSGIDFGLVEAGEIRGGVTSVQTGDALSGIEVVAYRINGSFIQSAGTDASGVFRLTGLMPGQYYVETSDTEYLDELYDNIPCPGSCDTAEGTLVTVAAGQVASGIDFALDLGGTASGAVTDAETGEPIPSKWIMLYGSQLTRGTATDSSGAWSVTGLWPGTIFALSPTSGGHAGVLWEGIDCFGGCDPTAGDPIEVAIASETSGISFELPRAPTISGTVTHALSGLPLPGAFVGSYDASGIFDSIGWTDTDGTYVVSANGPGAHYLIAGRSDFTSQLYEGLPCPNESCDPTLGVPVQVELGDHLTGFDFSLHPEARITGSVMTKLGDPIPIVGVRAFDPTGLPVGLAYSDNEGRFTVRGLATGSYFAEAIQPIAIGIEFGPRREWVSQLYLGIDCLEQCDPTTGTPIPTTSGSSTEIGFALTRYGHISGWVFDLASGAPITTASIEIYTSTGELLDSVLPSQDGQYEITGLSDGSYYVRATDPAYVDQVYDGVPCENPCDPTLGQSISVSVGVGRSGIDFPLNRLGSVSGTITDTSTGLPPASPVTVQLYTSSGAHFGVPTTADATGHYQVVGLPEGTFTAVASGGSYLDELYDDIPCEDGCTVTAGAPIIVTLGVDTPGIDFGLDPDAIFSDVPVGYWARHWIETLYLNGITSGCAINPLRYCPEGSLARQQMAVFLLASKEGPSYTPPPAIGLFADVSLENPFAPWIEELAARGITAGCSAEPPLFCPNATVNREQAAVFLLVTLEGPLYSPPPAVGLFDDVPAGDPFAPWIEELANRGITSGCSTDPPLYCPYAPVTRAQMAVFLVSVFGLQ